MVPQNPRPFGSVPPQAQQPYYGNGYGANPAAYAAGYTSGYPAGTGLPAQTANQPQQIAHNPLQQQAAVPAPVQPAIQPMAVAPAPVVAAPAPLPAMPQQPATPQTVQLDDDMPDVHDAEWVNRAKRVIGGTHGDPHRQVQLMQHLRAQYLKQRFGRMVHTDEG